MVGRLAPSIGTPGFAAALEKEYSALEKISIDYAIMEKANNVVMAKGTFYWDDVGSWTALENHFEKDGQGNVTIGNVEVLDADGNITYSKDRLTALIGVDDLIVVQADDVTLICPKDRAQDIKKLVHQMRESGNYGQVL
jgi:mannose-1-phosphate guanylyltransferase